MKGESRKAKRKKRKTDVLFIRKVSALKQLENILSVKFTKNEKWEWCYDLSTRKFWRKMQQVKQRIGYSA